MADNKPVIIVKKKGGHGGHHGGAWKVAYADFVTAMMAFFMVMWLVNSAEVSTKQNIAQYFRRPGIFDEGSGTPLLLGQAGILNDAYVPNRELKKGRKREEADKKKVPKTPIEPVDENMVLVPGDAELVGDLQGRKGKGPNDYEEAGSLADQPVKGGDDHPEPNERPKRTAVDEAGKLKDERGAIGIGVKEGKVGSGTELGSLAAEGATQGPHSSLGAPADSPGTDPEATEGSADAGLRNKLQAAEDAAFEDAQRERMEAAKREIDGLIAASPELADILGLVEVRIGADGLTIEIMDGPNASMFRSGSASILPEARDAFLTIGNILETLPNTFEITGHTDAKPFSSRSNLYSNWELSTDRAHAARRILESAGIAPSRISRVVGSAATDLRDKDDPLNPANRRITLKLKFEKSSSSKPGANRPVRAPGSNPPRTSRDSAPLPSSSPPKEKVAAEESAQPEQSSPQTTASANATTPQLPTPPVPTPTPEEEFDPTLRFIAPTQIQASANRAPGVVVLPPEPEEKGSEEAEATQSGDSGDGIFKDRPVIGPSDFIFGR